MMSVSDKIDSLLENVVASGVGAPIAPFGGGALKIEDSYAKPHEVSMGDSCSHQDPGSSKTCIPSGGTDV